MSSYRVASSRLGPILRWIARLWSIGTLLFIAAFAFGDEGIFASGAHLTVNESVALLLFPGALVAGMPVAWWREGLGGALTLAGLGAFYIWQTASTGRFPAGPFFALLAAPGLLFIISSWLSKSLVGNGPAARELQ